MVKNTGFDAIYQHVPAERRELLRRFRATHPYKRLITAGVEWEYILCGEGDQALLVLGGGMSTGESSFDTILYAEEEYRVVSPSYPPVGSMGIVTDGLAAILDAEGIARAHVMGHSLGAASAHVLVRRHPERVDKLVLSGFGLYNERNVRRARQALRLFGLVPFGLVKGYYKRRMAKLLSGLEEGDRHFMAAYLNDVLDRQHSRKTLMGQLRLMQDLVVNASAYHVYEEVEGADKVLILQAKDDTGFQPDEQAALRATYPHAKVYLFESGGHLAGITRRDEFDAVRWDFLRGGPAWARTDQWPLRASRSA